LAISAVRRNDGVVPRNVVTLTPRVLALPTRRNRQTRERVKQMVVVRFRARLESDPERIEMDFPKRFGGRAAKDQVAQALDQTDSRWPRVFVLYPTESSLRDKGE
jgi:hypothetical protein